MCLNLVYTNVAFVVKTSPEVLGYIIYYVIINKILSQQLVLTEKSYSIKQYKKPVTT